MVLQHTGFRDRDIMTLSESQKSGAKSGGDSGSYCQTVLELAKAAGCQENTEVSAVYNTILHVRVWESLCVFERQ